MSIRIITENDVRRVLTEKEALTLARETFQAIASKRVFMPPKTYLVLDSTRDFRAMPAYLGDEKGGGGAAGMKWICVFPENLKKGKPTVIGTILLNSAETGELLAVLEANTITAMRTAAAAALAAQLMGPAKPRVLAIVGAGIQAGYQLKAHADLYHFDKVRVWGYMPGEAERFCAANSAQKNLIPAADVKSCVEGADIVVTVTASRKPLVDAAWVKPGAHINAIGADAKGKQELDPQILLRSQVVVDEWEQASHSGEINVPISSGLFSEKNLFAELAELVAGRKKARTTGSETTVFDSTGLGSLDIHFSDYVYRKTSL